MSAIDTSIEYPLSVQFRLDSIQYKIVYTDNNYKETSLKSLEKTTPVPKVTSINYDAGSRYLIFIQNKNQRRLVGNFYQLDSETKKAEFIQKIKWAGYDDFFKYLEQFGSSKPFLLIKNVRRE